MNSSGQLSQETYCLSFRTNIDFPYLILNMRYILFLLMGICYGTAHAQFKANEVLRSDAVIYEEVQQPHVEDSPRSFLIFWKGDNGLQGCFNTTTDEFDAERSFPNPGYMVRPLEQLAFHGDSITFVCTTGLEFDESVPLFYRDEATALYEELPLWQHQRNLTHLKQRNYRGKIIDNQVIVLDDKDPSNINAAKRTFLRCK